MQARNANQWNNWILQLSKSRTHRRRADNTQDNSLVVIGFLYLNIWRQPAPPDRERKKRCRAGCFRALNIHIPAAVLKYNSRPPFSMPSYWRRPDAGGIGGPRREPPWSKERFDRIRRGILRYYDGYINKLCTRTLYELDGTPHVRVDEYMKHRLQNKLIRAILKDSL